MHMICSSRKVLASDGPTNRENGGKQKSFEQHMRNVFLNPRDVAMPSVVHTQYVDERKLVSSRALPSSPLFSQAW